MSMNAETSENAGDLRQAFAAIRAEAEAMAGKTTDLARRATVYHHIYRHSDGNFCFPLVAAHGALWAIGYFRLGRQIGQVLALRYASNPAERFRRLQMLEAFAESFREINRRVCVEVYAVYRFTSQHGSSAEASDLIEPGLLEAMSICHRARLSGSRLDLSERRRLFESFFRWEQTNVVGPAVDAAIGDFD